MGLPFDLLHYSYTFRRGAKTRALKCPENELVSCGYGRVHKPALYQHSNINIFYKPAGSVSPPEDIRFLGDDCRDSCAC